MSMDFITSFMKVLSLSPRSVTLRKPMQSTSMRILAEYATACGIANITLLMQLKFPLPAQGSTFLKVYVSTCFRFLKAHVHSVSFSLLCIVWNRHSIGRTVGSPSPD